MNRCASRLPRVRTDKGWRRFYAMGWLTSGVMTGVAFYRWRAYVREVEHRAEEAERTRDAVARERAVEERLRIARELHDSLTHSMSVIKVQSGVAVHLARKRGEPVPESLLAIQEASADATRELRATLGVLRRDDEVSATLDALPDLLDRVRSTGLAVLATVSEDLARLPSDVGRAAYRIVQEALTNVSRHSLATSACVTIGLDAGMLVVQVEDNGEPVATPPVPGLGLIGMRERVAALGGQLTAAPGPAGGFRICATMPVRELA